MVEEGVVGARFGRWMKNEGGSKDVWMCEGEKEGTKERGSE